MKQIIISILTLVTFIRCQAQDYGRVESTFEIPDTLPKVYYITDLQISGDTMTFSLGVDTYTPLDVESRTREQIMLVKKNNKWAVLKSKVGRLEEESETIIKKVWKYID